MRAVIAHFKVPSFNNEMLLRPRLFVYALLSYYLFAQDFILLILNMQLAKPDLLRDFLPGAYRRTLHRWIFSRLKMCLRVTLVISVFVPSLTWCQTAELVREPILFYGRYGGDFMRSFEVRIYPDRSLVYKGIQNTKVIGERRFEIADAQYKRILREFDASEFSKMQHYYSPGFIDGPYHLVITLNIATRKPKTVRAHLYPFSVWPKELHTLMWAIEDTPQIKDALCPTLTQKLDGHSVDLCQLIREQEVSEFKKRRN